MKFRTILTLGLVVAFIVSGILLEAQVKELTAAGATFPYPLYSKWFDVYHNETDIKINYQAIGSGGGIKQLLNKTVDFGGTDAIVKDKDMPAANPILHFPTCLGAVAVAYNLPGNPTLKLSGEIIADIFLGKITKWDDPRIINMNKGVKIPSRNIVVVHRSDGSGTTNVFSDFLAKMSGDWKEKVGVGKSLKWPVGLGGKGNPGVAGLIKQTKGSIGYMELAYAIQNNIPYAHVRNKSGNFIEPSVESVSLAADVDLPDDTRMMITNTDAAKGYPIAAWTWIIFYKEQNYGNRSEARVKEMLKLFQWVISDAQQYNKSLLYAPLPKVAVEKAEKIIKSVTYNGKPVLK
jgi:phosphate transport system substrate-binding protein